MVTVIVGIMGLPIPIIALVMGVCWLLSSPRGIPVKELEPVGVLSQDVNPELWEQPVFPK